MTGRPVAAINGVPTHYRVLARTPGAPGIVFINSLGTDFRIWEAVATDFARDHTVLVYDKRGHGLTGLGEPPYSIDDFASDLGALIDHVGLPGPVVVVGLSIGGMIAQRFYQLRPDDVAALVLSDTASKVGTPEVWDQRIATVTGQGLEAITETVMGMWFTPPFRETNPSFAAWRTMFVRNDPAGYTGACAALKDPDFREAAAAIAAPTLCLVGDQDGSTPPTLVEETANRIPGAQFRVIADAGHIPCVEQPAAFIAEVRAFLAGASPAKDRHATGMATRRRVLGDTHVDRAAAAATAFDQPFQDLITEGAWGGVWSRPDISPRERSMLTIALLAALGHEVEVAMHVRAAANTGTSVDDIREALLHVAIYAGVPAANRAFRIAKATLAERGTGGSE